MQKVISGSLLKIKQHVEREKSISLRESESLSVFIVEDVNGGLVALPEIIVTISNRKISLEKKMNLCH